MQPPVLARLAVPLTPFQYMCSCTAEHGAELEVALPVVGLKFMIHTDMLPLWQQRIGRRAATVLSLIMPMQLHTL